MAAVQSARAVRRKIRAVGNIRKITRAMQMVSASKLKRVQERLAELGPYSDKIVELVRRLAARREVLKHPLLTPRPEVNRIGLVVMMADKGLCGGYNANMARFAQRFIQERGKPVLAVAVGRKAAEFFRRQGMEPEAAFVQLPAQISFARVREMARGLLDMFESGRADEIHLLFTRYVNALTFRPGAVKFLPIWPERAAVAGGAPDYEFEPEPAAILDRLLPRYVEVSFHRLLLESMSSEHAARMNAMRNATDNATELIDGLTLVYNKARQSGITSELLDIVGGAEALRA